MVIVSHAVTLGGFGTEWIFQKTTLGLVAVYGFFGISGFLIAGSASHNGVLRYAWQRFLRIFPAYWVCLVVTGAFFGALAWLNTKHPASCGIGSCYFLHGNAGPVQYAYHNWLLRINQPNIGASPARVPYPGIWNGSLWSLFFEGMCYVLLAALAVTRLLRRRVVVLSVALGLWVTEIVLAATKTSISNTDAWGMLTLTPVFLAGTLLYLYRDKIRDAGVLALGAILGFVAVLWLPLGDGGAFWNHHATSTSVAAPLLAYLLLWLGIHLPFQRVGARNDYSYGLYIFAFPVQQILAVWGVQRSGYAVYLLLSIVMTAPFAVASWWLVERHALRWKKLEPRMLLRSRALMATEDARGGVPVSTAADRL